MKEKNNKKSRTAYWQQHLADWRKSGLIQAEYCRRNQISVKTFSFYKYKLNKTEFVELPEILLDTPTKHTESSFEIQAGENIKIKLSSRVDKATLVNIIKSLKEIYA